MNRITTTETATAEDNVRMAACDVAVARWLEPCWDALPERAKAQALKDISRRGIGRAESSSNTTCIELDELRVDTLKQGAPECQPIAEMAVGTDNTTPAHGNRSLNTEYSRTDVTEFIDNGSSLTVQVFLSKTEGNASSDLVELGLYAADYFLNHSLFTAITKTDSKAVLFEIDLSFDTA